MLNAAEAEVEKTKEAPDGTRWHESIRFAVPSRPSRKLLMISTRFPHVMPMTFSILVNLREPRHLGRHWTERSQQAASHSLS